MFLCSWLWLCLCSRHLRCQQRVSKKIALAFGHPLGSCLSPGPTFCVLCLVVQALHSSVPLMLLYVALYFLRRCPTESLSTSRTCSSTTTRTTAGSLSTERCAACIPRTSSSCMCTLVLPWQREAPDSARAPHPCYNMYHIGLRVVLYPGNWQGMVWPVARGVTYTAISGNINRVYCIVLRLRPQAYAVSMPRFIERPMDSSPMHVYLWLIFMLSLCCCRRRERCVCVRAPFVSLCVRSTT